jgi:5-methylcytosine-specific restriction protein A
VCRFFLDHQDTATELGRHRPHVNVVVDLDDVVGNGGGGRTLDGHLLDPEAIRLLLCDANVHRVVTDGAGSILDYGRSTRTTSPALFTALTLRDGHCRLVPGCDRGPEWCDAHHVVPWEDGGATNLANLVLGCSRHHHLLHRRRWDQRLAADGSLTITTPDGRTWTTHAHGAMPFRPGASTSTVLAS